MRADRDDVHRIECAVAIAGENADVAAAVVGRGGIEDAVAVDVAEDNHPGETAGGLRRARCRKRAVAVAEESNELASVATGNNEIGNAVAVHVRRRKTVLTVHGTTE